MIHIKGDIFYHAEEFDAMAHGCNTRGVMGAGIAAQVREHYGDAMYKWYKYECHSGGFRLGDIQFWHDPADILPPLFNLATQESPGPFADIKAIQMSMERMFVLANARNIQTIGIPMIGCGIGGLEWPDVEAAINEVSTIGPKLRVYSL